MSRRTNTSHPSHLGYPQDLVADTVAELPADIGRNPLPGPGYECAPDPADPLEGCPRATSVQLTRRDCAILRAIADGRCTISAAFGAPLTVDGYVVSDQFTVARLTRAGLITTEGPAPTRALLTRHGQELLRAA